MPLADLYRRYIDCLNRQDWANLGQHIDDQVEHNGRPFGLSGYRHMLIEDFRSIPDLHFTIDFLVCDPPRIAARLLFDCSPSGTFLGLPVNGQKVTFTENVFYTFHEDKITSVRSIVDKAAIEDQLTL